MLLNGRVLESRRCSTPRRLDSILTSVSPPLARQQQHLVNNFVTYGGSMCIYYLATNPITWAGEGGSDHGRYGSEHRDDSISRER